MFEKIVKCDICGSYYTFDATTGKHIIREILRKKGWSFSGKDGAKCQRCLRTVRKNETD